MGTDILEFMSSPAGMALVAFNSLTLIFVAIAGFFIVRSAGRTMQTNSEAHLLVIQQSTKLSDAANTALTRLTEHVGVTVESTQDAVTLHNLMADERHKAELSIQQQIADTLDRQTSALEMQSKTIQRQTELMNSQVAIMQDISDSDARQSDAIETRIAPSIEALRLMTTQLLAMFEKFSPQEVKDALAEIQASLNHLTEIIEQKETPPATEEGSTDAAVTDVPQGEPDE